MKRSLVSQEDLMEEVRLRALVDNLEKPQFGFELANYE